MRTITFKRSIVIGLFISFLFLILLVRIFYVQIINNDFYVTEAKKTWERAERIEAYRGQIFDRNSELLAGNEPAYNLSINPQLINDLKIKDEIVDGLISILPIKREYLISLIEKKQDKDEYYKQVEVRNGGWLLNSSQKDLINNLDLKIKKEIKKIDIGIIITAVQKRSYPNKELSSQIIGYVNKDREAINGIEKLYDHDLKPTNGEIRLLKDGKAVPLIEKPIYYKEPIDGKDIYLTIDKNIQYIVEESLKELQKKYSPKSATVIVADPKSMDILALANIPTFDPNSYWESNDYSAFYNHAIKSEYEPGSTFKIVTLAASVQEGLYNPNERYQSGSITVGGRTIHDIKRDGWGKITFLEGLKRSSNVEFIKLGYEKLKPTLLESYIRNFGFGNITGVELPGESKGVINLKYSADYAAASYGQGIQVTPMQQIAAIGAIANGGYLMQPHIVNKIVNPKSGEITQTKTNIVRQVISNETARKVGEYLELVVSDQKIGSGKNAYLEDYRVAGKTGTANKVENGKYAFGKHVVSFIGFAPVENPKLVAIVIVDEPNSSVAGGGTVAAPVFKEIILKSLKYIGAPRSNVQTSVQNKVENVITPNFTGQLVEEISKGDFNVINVGNGKILAQYPLAKTNISKSTPIYIFTNKQNNQFPKMLGSSLIDVVNVSRILGYTIEVNGEGYVEEQSVDTLKKIVKVKLKGFDDLLVKQ